MSAFKASHAALVFSFAAAVALMITWGSGFSSSRSESSYNLGNGLRLHRIQTLQNTNSRVDHREVGGVAWSPDGRSLAGYTEAGNLITIWSIDGTKQAEFRRDGTGPYVGGSIAFTRDGRTVVTPAILRSNGDNRYSLSLWDVKTGQFERSVDGPWPDKPWAYNRPFKFALSPDGKIAVTVSLSVLPLAVIYSTEGWQIDRKIGPSEMAIDFSQSFGGSIAFSPNSGILAIGRMHGKVSFLGLMGPNRELTTFAVYLPPGAISVGALAFSPDGEFLATGAHFDLNIASGQEHDPVKIWRVSDHSLVATYAGEPHSVRELSWSADGRYLAAAMSDKKIRILQPNDPQKFSGVADLNDSVNWVSFSPDGQKLAVAIGATVGIFSLDRE